MRRQVANLVTVLRIVLTLPFLYAVWRARQGASGWPAAACFAVIALSDFVDGRIARRLGAASPGGRVLDHGADIVFLLAALGLYAGLGLAPWWVPASVAAAFGVYVVDSLRRSGGRPTLIGSRLGHFGGVGNYIVVGTLVGNETVGLHWLPPAVMGALFALVPLYSGASILSRVAAGVAARAPAAPPRA